MTDKRDYFLELRIQQLITRREGMIWENKHRERNNYAYAYGEDSFAQIENELHDLESRT